MLKDMRTLWGVEAWRTYPWQIDVLRIEAEATQAERERVRAAFNFDPCHECDNSTIAWAALDAPEKAP